MKAIILFSLGVCLLGCNSSSPDTNTIPVEIVSNNAMNGEVWQVKKYLKDNLKDGDSYKPVKWGIVQKFDRGDIIAIRKPKVGCKFYDDAAHKEPDELSPFQKEDLKEGMPLTTMYVIADNGEWITFRFSPSATQHTAQGDEKEKDYWCKKAQTTEGETNSNMSDKYSVLHIYRAKNGFGAYDEITQTFYLDKDGNITHVDNE